MKSQFDFRCKSCKVFFERPEEVFAHNSEAHEEPQESTPLYMVGQCNLEAYEREHDLCNTGFEPTEA